MSGTDAALDASVDRDPLEQLAEEFLARRRQGEAVSVSEYAQGHPQLAQRICDLFPTLLLMEELKPEAVSAHTLGPFRVAGHAPKIERLGDFRILREIGRGGMGVVYEAEQESLGRHVALKVLPPLAVASPIHLERFQREAQAAARLHHTNIVPIFGVGQQDGIRYYVMQLICGRGLDQVLSTLGQQGSGPKTAAWGEHARTYLSQRTLPAFSVDDAARLLLAVPPTPDPMAPLHPAPPPAVPAAAVPALVGSYYWRNVARIGVQVADALEYAHRQGTLHRDIKPANLLLDNQGTVWIADFGLAKLADHEDLTRSGDMVGTLRYMAPEQFDGAADARSDIYSLGLTLYELLTLRPAYDEKNRRSLIRQVAQAEPARPRKLNPAIPRDLETIVMKAVAGPPQQRYQSAGDLAADLKSFLEDRPIRARRATPLGRLWRWCRRNRAVASLTGTALGLLIAVAVVASIGWLRTKSQRERAEANLHLATKAFEDIFGKVAADSVTQPANTDDDADTAEPAWEQVVTDKDAALLEGMLKFYDQFARQNDADLKLQEETALAYWRVGAIQRRLGQYEKAEVAYRRALATYEQLPDGSPKKIDRRTSMAAIDNELGVLFRETGRLPEARDEHLAAQQVLRRQPPAAAAAAESRFELARTYGYLSSMAVGHLGRRSHGPVNTRWPSSSGNDRQQEAVENNRRALEILEKLTAETPDNPRYRLATARSQRDRYLILSRAGHPQEADQARAEAIRILEELDAGPHRNPDYRCELAETYALFPSRRGEVEATPAMAAQLRRAVDIGTELVVRYPTVPEYRASLARSYLRWADVAELTNASADAEAYLTKAVDLEKGLSAEFPTVRSYRFFLSASLHRLADVQLARHETAQARSSLEQAVAQAQRIPQSAAEPSGVQRMLADQYGALAAVLRQLGETSAADAAAAKADTLGTHAWPHGHRSWPSERQTPPPE